VRLSNKTPCGTYRAPGRFEGGFVRERLVDAIAARLGLDPVEVRRVNLIPPSAMPFRRGFAALGTDVAYDTGDYPGLLDKCLARFDWSGLRTAAERRRQTGELVGLGLGFFVEKSGLGPFDDARIVLDREGRRRGRDHRHRCSDRRRGRRRDRPAGRGMPITDHARTPPSAAARAPGLILNYQVGGRPTPTREAPGGGDNRG
jgi:hypothetical protein